MDKKKCMALLLCLCLTAGLLTGCGGSIGQYEDEQAQAEQAEPADGAEQAEQTGPDEPDDDAAPEDEADDSPADVPDLAGEDDSPTDGEPAEPSVTPDPGLGAEAYDADTVVATFNGRDVSWKTYYYWLKYYVDYSDYLAAVGAFSYTDGWDGCDISPDHTNAEVVRLSAWDNLAQYLAADELAEQLDVSLGEDSDEQVQAAFERDADSMGDGDGECTDEEAAAFEDYLDEQFLDRETYEQMVRTGLLMDACLVSLYGEDGADLPDEQAVAYGEEQGLMQAKHILLMTVDSATGEELDEEQVQAKEEKINELYEQLSAVQEDHEALEALFDQLMEENTEDGGVDAFPDGYLFGEGVMVTAFEDTARALEEYGLSEPVQSDYGWHIILRLPIDPDGTVMTATGQTSSLRTAAASSDMLARLTETIDAAEVEWKDGFENVDIAEIFGER